MISYIVAVILFIAALGSENEVVLLAAGLFAIAGAIAMKEK